MQPKRYHKALVALHWLLALMLIVALPVNFDALPPRAVHGLVAKLLMLAIGLHIAAALYHHFIRRDGLLSRMGFGPR